jgi:hypothetical protein
VIDLVVLVAGKNEKYGLDVLLSRFIVLEIRQITYDIFVHPLRDPGIYQDGANFLRPLATQYSYALVFMDHEGSGQETTSPNTISIKIKTDIEHNGWPDRVEVIVFNPELENWVWAESQHTAETLGWSSYPELKSWLIQNGIWRQNAAKPERPKEALERSLMIKRIPRSSSIYSEIAQNVNLNICQDQSFSNLKNILQRWFPKEE